MTITIDTLQAVKDLTSKAGFKTEQAEMIVDIVGRSKQEIGIRSHLLAATARLTASTETVRAELTAAINRLTFAFPGALVVLFVAPKYQPDPIKLLLAPLIEKNPPHPVDL